MGGFDHLYKIFVDLIKLDLLKLDIFNKHVLSLILKIFETFLVAAFALEQQNIYASVERIKLFHIPLTLIAKNIAEEDENSGEMAEHINLTRKDSYDINLNRTYRKIQYFSIKFDCTLR